MTQKGSKMTQRDSPGNDLIKQRWKNSLRKHKPTNSKNEANKETIKYLMHCVISQVNSRARTLKIFQSLDPGWPKILYDPGLPLFHKPSQILVCCCGDEQFLGILFSKSKTLQSCRYQFKTFAVLWMGWNCCKITGIFFTFWGIMVHTYIAIATLQS